MDDDVGQVPGPRARIPVLITADLVVFTIRQDSLRVLLIRRANEPYRGMLALPGGFMRQGENLQKTAERELEEETSLNPAILHLEQLGVYSEPDRDPRERVISTAFLAIAPNLPHPRARTDAQSADWYEVTEDLLGKLSFDHAQILRDGLERARSRLEETTVATAFCAETFTMSDLRRVYEVVWGHPLDPRNFQRKVRRTEGFIIETGVKRLDGGRPAMLYRRGTEAILHPSMLRPSRDTDHSALELVAGDSTRQERHL